MVSESSGGPTRTGLGNRSPFPPWRAMWLCGISVGMRVAAGEEQRLEPAAAGEARLNTPRETRSVPTVAAGEEAREVVAVGARLA